MIHARKLKGRMTEEDPIVECLAKVFPQVDLSELRGATLHCKGDIDACADFVINNLIPIEDYYIDGDRHILIDKNPNLGLDPLAKKYLATYKENLMTEELMQSPAGASTSGQACFPEESNSDSLLAGSQNSVVDDEVIYYGNQPKVMHSSGELIGVHGNEQLECSSSEKNHGKSASENVLAPHDDVSPDMTIRPSYSASVESLDNAIAHENYKKINLLSNVAAISEMLEEVELNEARTILVVSEASQAGNDIIVKAEELKDMTTLATEVNNKVAGEVFAEKSILASETQGLQARLLNISEERDNFVSIIDEMHHTLQRRLAVAEAERAAAETEKFEKETMAQKMLKEQELLLDAAKEESKKLEQQAQENAKLKELLMDRGHVLDALHGEMLGIFETIALLQCRVNMHLPVDEPLQLASSSMSGSVKSAPSKLPVVEPLQLCSSSLSSSVKSAASKLHIVEPQQLASSGLSSSATSASSENSRSSAIESDTRLDGDEKTDDASTHGDFALDDSWDVVEDEAISAC